ncbi:hypothetical protein FRC06_005379, partial [Ceratobasidium sp. 370]
MSSNPSQRQPRPATTLPPIRNLIDAANQGMSESRSHPQAHPHYPPTPPTSIPMYGQNVQLPPLASRTRSRNDPAYPTPPNSARSDRPAAPASGLGGSRRHVCGECGQAFDRPSSLQ